jgi:hypothetical protein
VLVVEIQEHHHLDSNQGRSHSERCSTTTEPIIPALVDESMKIYASPLRFTSLDGCNHLSKCICKILRAELALKIRFAGVHCLDEASPHPNCFLIMVASNHIVSLTLCSARDLGGCFHHILSISGSGLGISFSQTEFNEIASSTASLHFPEPFPGITQKTSGDNGFICASEPSCIILWLFTLAK